jgi:hypothetical protein
MQEDATRNIEATARLREFVSPLTAPDLARDLGGGWTVAMALGHLAFWDRFQTSQLRLLAAGEPAAEDTDAVSDVTNEALQAVLAALSPDEVGRLATTAAADVDAAVVALPEALMVRLASSAEHAYLVRRWAHREEHIEQIRGALSASR